MATKKATKSKVNAAGVYTKPGLREGIFKRINLKKGGTVKSKKKK